MLEAQRGSFLGRIAAVLNVVASLAALGSTYFAAVAIMASYQTQLSDRRYSACTEVRDRAVSTISALYSTGGDWRWYEPTYVPEQNCRAGDVECRAREAAATRKLNARLERVREIKTVSEAKFTMLGPAELRSAEAELLVAMRTPSISDQNLEKIEAALSRFTTTCGSVLAGSGSGQWTPTQLFGLKAN